MQANELLNFPLPNSQEITEFVQNTFQGRWSASKWNQYSFIPVATSYVCSVAARLYQRPLERCIAFNHIHTRQHGQRVLPKGTPAETGVPTTNLKVFGQHSVQCVHCSANAFIVRRSVLIYTRLQSALLKLQRDSVPLKINAVLLVLLPCHDYTSLLWSELEAWP